MSQDMEVGTELEEILQDKLREGVDICNECDFKMSLDKQIYNLPKMKMTTGTVLDGIPTLRYICDNCGAMKLFSLRKIVPDWKQYM